MARETAGSPTFGLIHGRESRVAFLIRLFSTFRGERPSVMNHVFLLREDGESIVESIPTGTVERSWRESYDNDRHWGVLVEPAGLTPEERATIEEKSIVYLGRRYGNVALVKHFLDGTLGWLAGRDVYLFRRLRLPWLKPSPLYNTCSWLVCWTHLHAAWRFHGPEGALPCHRTTPDDLWDDVFEHRPDAYLIRAEIGVRPVTVSAAHIAKIERDLGVP